MNRVTIQIFGKEGKFGILSNREARWILFGPLKFEWKHPTPLGKVGRELLQGSCWRSSRIFVG